MYIQYKCLALFSATHCTDTKGGKVAIGGEYTDAASCKTLRCTLEGYSVNWVTTDRGTNLSDHLISSLVFINVHVIV